MEELKDLIGTFTVPSGNFGKSKSPPKDLRGKFKKTMENAKLKYALGKLFIILHIKNQANKFQHSSNLKKKKAFKVIKYFEDADNYMILDDIARNCYGMKTKHDCDKYREEGATAFLKNYKRMAFAYDLYDEYKKKTTLQRSSSQRSPSQRSSSQRSSSQRSSSQRRPSQRSSSQRRPSRRLTDEEFVILFEKEMENVTDDELAKFRGSIDSNNSNYNSAKSSFSKSKSDVKEGGKNKKSKKVIKKNSTYNKKLKKVIKKNSTYNKKLKK